jgi:dCMP deaminase
MTPDHSIVATGYNGAPSGEPGCLTAGACPRGSSGVAPGSSYDTGAGTCIAIHAEQNALLRATWADMVAATLYITDEPCQGCQRTIMATPIARWVTPREHL